MAGYVTPGKLFQPYKIERKRTEPNERGRRTATWEPIGEVRAVLADATVHQLQRWNQIQHPGTHTITHQGPPRAKANDRLVRNGRTFYVHTVIDGAELGLWTVYEVEERKDT